MSPRDLSSAWRFKAEELNELGAEPQAQALEWCADELEAAWREWQLEAIPLEEAARESGYSVDHLGRLVREGTIPNAGQAYAPRIRRLHVPRKPGHRAGRGAVASPSVSSREQIARAVVNSPPGGHDG